MRRRLRPSAELRAEAWLLAVPAVTLSLDMACQTYSGRHPRRTANMRAPRRRTRTRAALTRDGPLLAQLERAHHPVTCRQEGPKETIRQRQLEVQLVGEVQGLHDSQGAALGFDEALHRAGSQAERKALRPRLPPKGAAHAPQSVRQAASHGVLNQGRRIRRKKMETNQKPRDQRQEVKILRVTVMVPLRHHRIPQAGATRNAMVMAIPSLLHVTVW